jgi:enamine deaminase RidA (YjgF/YER057c/UK114 family)
MSDPGRLCLGWPLAAAALALLPACTLEQRTDRVVQDAPEESSSEFLRPWGESAPPAGVKSGDLVWIWAMSGTVPGSVPPRLVEGGIVAETRQALDNIVAVLAAAGAEPRDVGQCSVFLADGAEAEAMGAVYREYFPVPPLRVAATLDGLSAGGRVEIECTAVVPAEP